MMRKKLGLDTLSERRELAVECFGKKCLANDRFAVDMQEEQGSIIVVLLSQSTLVYNE